MIRKNFLIYLCFLTLSFLGFSCSSRAATDQVCFHDRCVEVEIVKDPEALMRGLQFRKELPIENGMLFVFPQSAVYPFWMKNTLIALDMVWIDGKNEVVHIQSDVPPCQRDPCPSYNPQKEALYVLEVNAGQAEELGINLGDRVDFRLADTE